jgi:hypothetical protein
MGVEQRLAYCLWDQTGLHLNLNFPILEVWSGMHYLTFICLCFVNKEESGKEQCLPYLVQGLNETMYTMHSS